MRKLILMVGLVVVAIACGTGADMMGEIMDSGVPDAGAQPGALRVECDIPEGGNSKVALVAASELPGVFNAYLCTEAPEELHSFLANTFGEAPVCIIVSPVIMADGRYGFDCETGNGGYGGSTFTFPEPSHIRIVR